MAQTRLVPDAPPLRAEGRNRTGKTRRILRWTQLLLFASGVSMLAYCAFVLTDASMFQKEERLRLERPLEDRNTPPASNAGLIGRLEIGRLGLSAIVMEGTGPTTLQRALGHIPGTALPGQPGNVGISGHRDTFFRPLRNIRQNDIIMLTTPLGAYRYRVVSTKVVRPSDVAVLDSTGNEVLTLVTCYPFYFLGSAPNRFIVRAERVTGPSDFTCIVKPIAVISIEYAVYSAAQDGIGRAALPREGPGVL